MKNNNGFTLLELLVAATIIGILAVFATVSYKNSAAEARIAASKTRTEALAGAVQRYNLEHAPLNTQRMNSTLLKDYIENHNWDSASEYVTYYVCKDKDGDCANSPVLKPLACMKGKVDSQNNPITKLPTRYQKNYIYCVSATDKGETFN